jgi:uncharacterized lipoprotein YajG
MRLQPGAITFMVGGGFSLLLCAGCSSGPVKIHPRYVPTELGLLSNLRSVTLSVEVVDQRPDEQLDSIGVQRNTVFGTRHATVASDTPVTQVVYDALRAELEKSGHRVLSADQGPPEISLSVALTEFVVDSKASDMNIELIGQIRAYVAASGAGHEVPQVAFPVDGTYPYRLQLGWLRPFIDPLEVRGLRSTTRRRDIQRAMNGALPEFVGRLCTTPAFRQLFVAERM